MATFRSFSDLEQQLIKDVRLAAESARNEIDKELQDNVMDYYGSGNPVKYERTGTLLESPNTTPVSGGGNHFTFESYLDENISYHTGTFSGAEVIDATEQGHSGTLGKHGYFKRTEEAVPKILEKTFSQL